MTPQAMMRYTLMSALWVADNEGQIDEDEFENAQAWVRLSLPDDSDSGGGAVDDCHTLLEAGWSEIPNEVKI